MASAPHPGAIARLSAALLAAIEAAARRARPHEACGLLIGRRSDSGFLVTRIVASANLAAPARSDRFEIDPVVQLHWQKVLRGTGEAVIGHYHSHPQGQAEPSPADIEEAHDETLLWLITAFSPRDIAVTGGFVIDRRHDRAIKISLDIR